MGSAQQVLQSLLAGSVPNNEFVSQTSAVNATSASATEPQSLLAFLFSFSSSFHDWIKLAILGAILEFARRTWAAVWAAFLASFFITAHFDGGDECYDWLMVFLSKKSSWKKANELQVSTRNWSSSNRYQNDDQDIVIMDDPQGDLPMKGRTLSFLPSFGNTTTMFYKGRLLRVTRDRTQAAVGTEYVESLTLSILGRDHAILRELLLEAQTLHKSQEQNRVAIYIADNYNNWRWSGSRPKRPMSSIILEPGVKEMLIEDAKDFLTSEDWYAARGIPFRRGYLLHGAPGSGKTSLIHAVAGALGLDIYVISLSRKGLDDASLNELICDLPARSIALMEDIDAAFTHGVSRDGVDGVDESDGGSAPSMESSSGTGVTLSGLLGAIDGVAAQEGRILFATTNRYQVLDAALVRPGRLDLHVEFKLATSWQAEEIFKCFYPATENISDNSEEPIIEEKTPVPSTSSDGLPTLEKHTAPKLSVKQRDALAAEFAVAVPDRLTSMASIQGHLMTYKTRPYEAVKTARDFVELELKKRAARESEKKKIVQIKKESDSRDEEGSSTPTDI
ncbi:hypothetical protein FRC04_008098 [Tulasnella sp. 424]|nr:hypothetical protein FRC04_008098 [Tulasnella sp. 424]KAG8974755.1 hypothetical protein FRC05_006915 [Tulasnella sp. 425]